MSVDNCVKVGRNEFLDRVSKRLKQKYGPDVTSFKVHDVAEAMEKEFRAALMAGEKISWSGIGTIYVTVHKGHPVQFGRNGKAVLPYKVCKFSPSGTLMKAIREEDGAFE